MIQVYILTGWKGVSIAAQVSCFCSIRMTHGEHIAQSIVRATHIVVSSFARETVSSMRFPKLSSIGFREHWTLCDFAHDTSLNVVHFVWWMFSSFIFLVLCFLDGEFALTNCDMRHHIKPTCLNCPNESNWNCPAKMQYRQYTHVFNLFFRCFSFAWRATIFHMVRENAARFCAHGR